MMWIITMPDLWTISEDSFDPQKQHHKETIFTIGNGYLCTRGSFEEGYPDDRRAMNLELTAAGKVLYPQLLAAKETVQAQFLRGFGKAEVQQLESFLNRMLDNR